MWRRPWGNSAEDKGLKHHRRKRHTGSKRAVPERQYGHYGSPGSIKGRRGNKKEIAQASESKGGVGAEEIRAMTEEKKGRKTKEEETREANVSDTDTTEEEKENARKLHAVKMIEKYYTWLNEEEVGILEAMLEDCKRRKREYTIEEE